MKTLKKTQTQKQFIIKFTKQNLVYPLSNLKYIQTLAEYFILATYLQGREKPTNRRWQKTQLNMTAHTYVLRSNNYIKSLLCFIVWIIVNGCISLE